MKIQLVRLRCIAFVLWSNELPDSRAAKQRQFTGTRCACR